MRVSTNGAYLRSLSLMQEIQASINHTQRQISSGRRMLSPSDDPIAAAQLLDIRESVTRLDQFERNGNIARNRLSFEEAALGNASNTIQRVRELAIQANNATQSNESRASIATELREQLDALVQIANRKDGNGRYLFSGNKDATEPVSRSGDQYVYNGDFGQRMIQIGESRRLVDGDPGADVFFRVKNGNGVFSVSPETTNTGSGVVDAGSVLDQALYNGEQYTVRFIDPENYEVLDSAAAAVAAGQFQDGDAIAFGGIQIRIDGQPLTGDEFSVSPSVNGNVFAAIDALASAVTTVVDGDTSRAEMSNGINAGILSIDQALGEIIEVRTRVGSRLSAIDSQEDANAGTTLALQQTIGDLEDLDYAAALSKLSLEASVLEAAQQSFVRTQSLSLFNFL